MQIEATRSCLKMVRAIRGRTAGWDPGTGLGSRGWTSVILPVLHPAVDMVSYHDRNYHRCKILSQKLLRVCEFQMSEDTKQRNIAIK